MAFSAMMAFSHSKVETFNKCPYLFSLKYVEKLRTLKYVDEANNALFLGIGMHTGIEKTVVDGIKAYYNSYPIISDLHVNEAIKLEYLIPKVKALMSGKNVTYEYELDIDNFKGYIDALVEHRKGYYTIYDFKYSNNVEHYLESPQLHIYKYFFERMNPDKKVTKLGYIFVPKTMIRQKKTEDLRQFRKRLNETLSELEITTKYVTYDEDKVNKFFHQASMMNAANEFPKCESRLCDFCEFNQYCKLGDDYMILPDNEKRDVCKAKRKKIWLYGAPFSGKTTLANQFPNAIMLNTDGNLNSFNSPVISIKETIEGRITIPAWKVFIDAVDELQKGKHTFETIVVDLIEDVYEHCRTYCCNKLGIDHESDNSFKAYDYVRKEFLDAVKKLTTLPYNIVLISHEDLSKDITKKTGDKITAIKPNIAEKVANKLAGMVDVVARVIASGDERTLNFKSDDVVFGGGRLQLNATSIPCSYESLDALYHDQDIVKTEIKADVKTEVKAADEVKPEVKPEVKKTEVTTALKEMDLKPVESEPAIETPAPRQRRRRIAQ